VVFDVPASSHLQFFPSESYVPCRFEFGRVVITGSSRSDYSDSMRVVLLPLVDRSVSFPPLTLSPRPRLIPIGYQLFTDFQRGPNTPKGFIASFFRPRSMFFPVVTFWKTEGWHVSVSVQRYRPPF